MKYPIDKEKKLRGKRLDNHFVQGSFYFCVQGDVNFTSGFLYLCSCGPDDIKYLTDDGGYLTSESPALFHRHIDISNA